MRREWRDGCPAGMAYQTALGSVRRLRPVAASEQIADDLRRVIDDLDAYTTLPPERRPAALTEIATAIKRLIPEVARLDGAGSSDECAGYRAAAGAQDERPAACRVRPRRVATTPSRCEAPSHTG